MVRRIPWLALALAVAAILVVVLAMQNRSLREDNLRLAERATAPYPGMWVPEIAATALDGRAVSLGAPRETAQVLYFFTPQCPYCRRTAPQIRALEARLQREAPGVALIGIADADAGLVRDHAREQRYGFPIVATSDHRTIGLFKANTVPTVVVVRRGGRVGYGHVGAIETREGVDAILDAVRKPQDAGAPPQSPDAVALASRQPATPPQE